MKFFSRQSRRTVSPKPRTARPRLEPLDSRLLLSGFGTGDGGYIVEPWVGSYHALQIQPGDQKIVATGTMSITNPDGTTEQRMAIARYDSLGNPDTTYGSGAPSIPPLSGVSAPPLGPSSETGWDIVLQPTDGKAVVSGQNSGGSSFAVARFNTDGTLDSGFGNGGWTSLDASTGDFYNPAEGVGLQSNGKVVVAGGSLSSGSYNPAEVARFTATGNVDSGRAGFGQVVHGLATGYTLNTFGFPHNVFHDFAVQPDDKLVAVGLAYTDGTSRRLIVTRFTASGTLDKTFNGKGYSVFLPAGISDAFGRSVALQPDGKIVVTGFCTGTDGASDMLVARYNSDGTLDTSFGAGTGYVRLDDGAVPQSQEFGNSVAIQPADGKIVVGGQMTDTSNLTSVMVARFNVDGTPDGTFAPGGFKIEAPLPNTSFGVQDVALLSDGSIIIAGGESAIGHPYLMHILPTTASPLKASGGAAPASSQTAALTLAQVQAPRTEGSAGSQATETAVSGLASLDVRIASLSDRTVASAPGHTIAPVTHSTVRHGIVVRTTRRGSVPQVARIDPLSAWTTP